MSGLLLLCTELTLFCIELPENCIYLNQSELSNFFMYVIDELILFIYGGIHVINDLSSRKFEEI